MTSPITARARSVSDALFEALRDHPLLSRRQLELCLAYSSAGVRYGLRELRKRKWIGQVNARQPGIRARALYLPTPAGIQELAHRARVPYQDYISRTRLSPARINRLLLTIERVFQLHMTFLWLSRGEPKRRTDGEEACPNGKTQALKAKSPSEAENNTLLWRPSVWDVDVGKLFSAKGQAVWISFHGAALMVRGADPSRFSDRSEVASSGSSLNSRDNVFWTFIVVEFDTGRAPVAGERERLTHFVAAQDDPRYWAKDKEALFPVLVVIAHNELRLQEYYNLLRSAALSRHLPMPRAYLTTAGKILSLREHPGCAVWYSTISGHETSLLFDTEGVSGPLPDVPWRKLPLVEPKRVPGTERREDEGLTSGEAEKKETGKHASQNAQGLGELAQLSLELTPLAKLLLDEISAHPLLNYGELALLLKVTARWARPALAKMVERQLVALHQGRYLIAEKGQAYLAHAAGYGNAVTRYARARGWANGFEVLLRHFEHTQEENRFFLNLARVALKRCHWLTWLSELEGRLYYEAGGRWHSFLPDGRGTYSTRRERYEFALEIDRSRTTPKRLRGKLMEYDACVSSQVLWREGVEFLRLLVVTTSWERADAWRQAALDAKVRLPVLITTFDRLDASGIDAAIWLRGNVANIEPATTSHKVACFACFDDGPG